jgi:hypothetical protein
MWNSDDPKTKWMHLALKLVAAIIIFKLGVMVGEFKMIKAMVLRGGGEHKMLFKGGDGEMGAGARFFHKRVMPMMGEGDKVMMWKGDKVEMMEPGAPVPPPAQ